MLYSLIDSMKLFRVRSFIQSTIGEDGNVWIYQISDQDISRYVTRKKRRWKRQDALRFSTGAYHHCALTYNRSLKAIVLAYGGSAVCWFYQPDMMTARTGNWFTNCSFEGAITCIDFVHGTDLVVLAALTCSPVVYDYVAKRERLKLQGECAQTYVQDHGSKWHKPKSIAAAAAIDHYLRDEHTMIVAYCDPLGFVHINTVHIEDDNSLKVLYSQKIDIVSDFGIDLNVIQIYCIAISSGAEYIVCGLDGQFVMLRLMEQDTEYQVLSRGDAECNHDMLCCCWVDGTTFVFAEKRGGATLIKGTVRDFAESEYMKILSGFLEGQSAIAAIICGFCGHHVEIGRIQTRFDQNSRVWGSRVWGMKSLPNYNIAPGLFVVSSWDTTSNLFIPRDVQ